MSDVSDDNDAGEGDLFAGAMDEWRAAALEEAIADTLAEDPDLSAADLHARLVAQEEWETVDLSEVESVLGVGQLTE
eukprot:5502930-Prymnesium_polylepis.1